MRRRLIQLTGVCVMLTFLTGCLPMNDEKKAMMDGSGDTQNSEVVFDWETEVERLKRMKPAEVPEHLTLEVSSILKFNSDILLSDELEDYRVPKPELTRHLFDVDKDMDSLLDVMGNPEVKKMEDRISDEILPDGSETKVKTAELGENRSVQVRQGRFGINQIYGTIYQTLEPMDMYADWYNTAEETLERYYREDKELSFMTSDEAKEKVTALMSAMGIGDIGGIRCFALSRDALQQHADVMVNGMKASGREPAEIAALPQTVKDSDEGYYVTGNQCCKGIPFFMFGMDRALVNYVGMIGTKIDCIITKNGIIYGSMVDLYDQGEVSGETQILPLGDIMEQFIRINNDEAVAKQTIVKHMGLCYLPVLKDADSMTFDTMPVYYILYDWQYPDSEIFQREINVYDAETGERIQ